MHHSYGSDDRRTGTTRATLRSGFHDPLPVLYRFGGLIMTIASLKWSQKATATREVLASNDVRTLIANQLGVDVKRVTDEAHFTDDLGADWLGRLELMIVIEDRFADVVITDEEVDQLEVVGDLIRHIENADHERATTLHRRGDDDAEQHKQAKDMAPVLPLEIIYRDANSHPPDATVSAPTRTSSLFGPMIRGLFLPVIAIHF